MTNFERITESPEKMAEFLADIGSCRKFQAIGICPVGGCGERHNQCEGAALDWLEEESVDGGFVDELSEAVDEVIESYPNALEMLGKD